MAHQRQAAAEASGKLAPWAKKSQVQNHVDEATNKMSLMEIQRLEAEREREEAVRREEHARMIRAQQEKEEEEARKRAAAGRHNWASTVGTTNGGQQQKSLAEIQAEEARNERERQERIKSQRLARQKEMGLAQASVWGNASANLSWANKAQGGSPAQQQSQQQQPPQGYQQMQRQQQQQQQVAMQNRNGAGAEGGFWDEAPSNQPQPQQSHQQRGQQQAGKKNKGKNNNSAKNNSGAASGKNIHTEWENWCQGALESLHAQVDIPTFLSFLKDIESPYEVSLFDCAEERCSLLPIWS